jgi:hypothetical protein
MWLRHSQLLFQHAECDFDTMSVILTLTSVITTSTSVISTRIVILARRNVITILTTLIWTCTRVIPTHLVWHSRVWLIHARVEFKHDVCDFNTNQLKIYVRITKKFRFGFWIAVIPLARVWFSQKTCDFGTLLAFWTIMRVIFTLMRAMLVPSVWFWHPGYDFGILLVIWTLMRVILTRYVLNYFITIYK